VARYYKGRSSDSSGARPRRRGGRRGSSDPAWCSVAGREALGEHPDRLCPRHRDHPPAPGRLRAVVAGLVPGGGRPPGHRLYRAHTSALVAMLLFTGARGRRGQPRTLVHL